MKARIILKFALAACLSAAVPTLRAQFSPLTNTFTNPLTNQTVVDIRATDPFALEGSSTASFTLLRRGDTGTALNVGLLVSGSASNGVDYEAVSNIVTIPAGFLAVDIPITPIVVHGGNKTVRLTIEPNSDYLSGFRRGATVFIIDDTFSEPLATVTITSPTNGSVFVAPATFTVTATGGDSDFAVSSVSFFAGDLFLGRATNSPFSIMVTNLATGNYDIFARAMDAANQSAFSKPVAITVGGTNTGVNPITPSGPTPITPIVPTPGAPTGTTTGTNPVTNPGTSNEPSFPPVPSGP